MNVEQGYIDAENILSDLIEEEADSMLWLEKQEEFGKAAIAFEIGMALKDALQKIKDKRKERLG